MPIYKSEDSESHSIPGSTYQFSAIRPEKLGAAEYTLVTIVIDITGSVYQFADDLLKMLKAVIDACNSKKNPRRENLLIRVITFNQKVYEIHGFLQCTDIKTDDYEPFDCDGRTALFDAGHDAIGATLRYSANLLSNDFEANGAIYIITDGDDNYSKITEKMIADQVKESRKEEKIESLLTVLIGVNTKGSSADGESITAKLARFKERAELSQYIDMGDVTEGKLLKLGGFISQSISAQSQAVGSGQASQPVSLTF